MNRPVLQMLHVLWPNTRHTGYRPQMWVQTASLLLRQQIPRSAPVLGAPGRGLSQPRVPDPSRALVPSSAWLCQEPTEGVPHVEMVFGIPNSFPFLFI